MAVEALSKPCNMWQGVRDQRGYGTLTINGVGVKAHRVAYRLHVGKIPRGMYVCHRCDNPPCFEPSHLFAGTPSDNQRDSVAKKRHWESRKTHCSNGHEYSTENTRIREGKRKCRQCDRDRQRAARDAKNNFGEIK